MLHKFGLWDPLPPYVG